MPTKKVIKKISELNINDRLEMIAKILKGRRDELCAKILYNTGIDEKIYSETDHCKLEIRILNKILRMNSLETEVEEEISEEEYMKDEELEVGSMDDIFNTQE